jgi:hypothetical protein
MVDVAAKANVSMANVIAPLALKVTIAPSARNARMDAAPMVSAATENVYVFLVTLAKIAPMHLHVRKILVKMVCAHKAVVFATMGGPAKHVR